MKIVFLHIPKTAGQSVHAALVNAFGEEATCPARVNTQLSAYSISALNRYQVFSGHFDWSMLDCIKGPKYVFTVLREPMDRILSFYFFLRDEAARLSPAEMATTQRQNMKAAATLSPIEYFTGGTPHLRRFIDDHYDNFYAYYFAGRNFRSRGELAAKISRGEMTLDEVMANALDNLAQLDGVFTVERIDKVFAMIRSMGGRSPSGDEQFRVNVNSNLSTHERRDKLIELGADEKTLARIESFCTLDDQIWRRYASAAAAGSAPRGTRI
jgi:hypothetical protein